jgi:enoyl-CoA hydratase/carnithine racemase
VTEVRVAKTGCVAEIILDAPDRRNALTGAMAKDLQDAIDDVSRQNDVCAVILRGDGGWFCAGADRAAIQRAQRDPAEPEVFSHFDAIYETFVAFAELPVPTIAAVRGGAVGAGLNLALAADVRIVADDARLMSGFLRIGVHPGGGHFQLLTQAVGRERAAAMSLLGIELHGVEAVVAGLALEAVADASVEARALELANRLRDPELVRMATRTWRNQCAASEIAPHMVLRAEQAAQMWSFRRAAARSESPSH